jgi:hypothetical protein
VGKESHCAEQHGRHKYLFIQRWLGVMKNLLYSCQAREKGYRRINTQQVMEGGTQAINKHKVTAVEHTNDCLLGYKSRAGEEGALRAFFLPPNYFHFWKNIYK